VTDRIDRCLDGGVAVEDMTAEERTQVEAIVAAAGVLRASIPSAPATLEAATLRQIRALQPVRGEVAANAPLGGRAGEWVRAAASALWRPRTLTVRPAFAAALVILAAALVVEARLHRPAAPGAVAATAALEAPLVYVQFRLEAQGASSVNLAGSFTSWQPEYELVEASPGTWTVVIGLPPGVHDYAFVVDREQWVVDPAAATVDDGFGGQNSRIALLQS
jgi:hypothetical protein